VSNVISEEFVFIFCFSMANPWNETPGGFNAATGRGLKGMLEHSKTLGFKVLPR
jgi:hypothetical protein